MNADQLTDKLIEQLVERAYPDERKFYTTGLAQAYKRVFRVSLHKEMHTIRMKIVQEATDAVLQAQKEIKPDFVPRNFEVVPAEPPIRGPVVDIIVFQDNLYVATTHHVYRKDKDGVLRPLLFELMSSEGKL